jgi:hypothetical protein
MYFVRFINKALVTFGSVGFLGPSLVTGFRVWHYNIREG